MATFWEIAARSVSNLFSLYFVYLLYLFISRFGFKSGICLLIAPVPVHCFSITFNWKINRIKCHSRRPYNCNQTRHSVKEGKFHLSHMSERQKLGNAEKRPIFRQSIYTWTFSTQAPELLACVRQNRFVYGKQVFDVTSSLSGIHKRKHRKLSQFLSSFTAKDHFL